MAPFIEKIRSRLNHCETSQHYSLLYGYRDARTEFGGIGIDGIRSPMLLFSYIEGLERLYDAMTGIPFARPVIPGRTTVLVCRIPLYMGRGDPFTTRDGREFIIGLPSRRLEPDENSAFNLARADAIHEATHVFNFLARPPQRSLIEKGWQWFNEATAVFMERFLLHGTSACLRYIANWVDRPEVPLDHRDAEYEAGMFACYLSKRFGPRILTRIWTESGENDRPFDVLRRLLPGAASESALSCFAEYCEDSYFLWDHESNGFALDVFLRYGHRATTDSIKLRVGDKCNPISTTIDHLACRYFRITTTEYVRSIHVRVSTNPNNDAMSAKLLIIGKALHKGPEATLVPDCHGNLTASLESLSLGDIDHSVLVVANCGIGPAHDGRECNIFLSAS